METSVTRVGMKFEFLTDAKTMFELLMRNLEQTRAITMHLEVRGMPINSRCMAGYRADARFILSSLLAAGDEILRLHEQCTDEGCEFTNDPSGVQAKHDEAEAGVIKILRAIEQEEKEVSEMELISEDEEITILARAVIRDVGN